MAEILQLLKPSVQEEDIVPFKPHELKILKVNNYF